MSGERQALRLVWPLPDDKTVGWVEDFLAACRHERTGRGIDAWYDSRQRRLCIFIVDADKLDPTPTSTPPSSHEYARGWFASKNTSMIRDWLSPDEPITFDVIEWIPDIRRFVRDHKDKKVTV